MYGSIGHIDENTSIEEDYLTVTGDEAVDFLIEYGKCFNVDISNFQIDRYFKGEGSEWIIGRIINEIRGKEKESRKPFTVGDLIKGIQAGRLDEEVLAKEDSNKLR